MSWNTKSDTLTIYIGNKNKHLTRRGSLLVISSMYDLLGMVVSSHLNGRLIIQEVSRFSNGWDEIILEPLQVKWIPWMNSLNELTKVALERCINPKEFGSIVSCHLPNFCDASEKRYGCVSYIRLSNADDIVHCEFLFEWHM